MATIRSFVAIELSDSARQSLATRQRDLKAAVPPQTIRWTAPDSIHLTLQFLGDVPLDRIPDMTSALRDVCAGTTPFTFDLIGLGVFPDRRRPHIVWVGVREPSGALAALHSRVGQALAALGFPPEERTFAPHLTIGRAARDAAPRDLVAVGEQVARSDVGLIARIPVGHMALMKSDLRPTGALYTAQATFALGAK
jgi:RNA 2',3'-cyclic 3'-phosphodiesterase